MTIPGSGVGVGVGERFFSCFQYSESEDKGGMGIPPYSRLYNLIAGCKINFGERPSDLQPALCSYRGVAYADL